MGVETSEQRVGVRVICVVCCLQKKPRGRSAPAGIPYCDDDCRGYDALPNVGSLWPGETEGEFGHPVADWGTVKIPKFESTLRVQDAPEVVREDAEGKPPFYCVDWEAKVLCRCTIQCNGCALTEKLNVAKPLSPYSPKRLPACQDAWKATLGVFGELGERNAFSVGFDAGWEAALRTRPEGEAKVKWRVDQKFVRPGVEEWIEGPEYSSEEVARDWLDSDHFTLRLVKIETYETVVETRKK